MSDPYAEFKKYRAEQNRSEEHAGARIAALRRAFRVAHSTRNSHLIAIFRGEGIAPRPFYFSTPRTKKRLLGASDITWIYEYVEDGWIVEDAPYGDDVSRLLSTTGRDYTSRAATVTSQARDRTGITHGPGWVVTPETPWFEEEGLLDTSHTVERYYSAASFGKFASDAVDCNKRIRW